MGIQIALQEARTRRNGVEGMLAGASITQKRFEELHPPVEREVRQLETKVQVLQKKWTGNSGNAPTLTLAEWKKQWTAWPTKRQRQILTTFVERVTLGDGEVEIAYLLSDSSSKDATQTQTNQPSDKSTFIGQFQRWPGLHPAAQARRKMPHHRPQPGEAKRAGSPERTEPFQPAGGQHEPP